MRCISRGVNFSAKLQYNTKGGNYNLTIDVHLEHYAKHTLISLVECFFQNLQATQETNQI